MTNTWVYPYKPGSASGRALAQALGVRRISHRNSTFRGRPEKLIINWGASRVPEEVSKCTILNRPGAVHGASDKLMFFRNAECRKPEWTEDPQVAKDWLWEGSLLVCRTVLNGNSGEGIILYEGTSMDDQDSLPGAPLYVKYVPKRQEYRVHVFRGEVIDVQRKARRRDVPDDQINWKVRNHANGFVFARNGDALGDVPDDVLHQATDGVTSLGLDFGAADVIYNDRSGLAYVLEVNTAPGLEGTTLDNYVRAFRGLRE